LAPRSGAITQVAIIPTNMTIEIPSTLFLLKRFCLAV
jgi:hypothetical protein